MEEDEKMIFLAKRLGDITVDDIAAMLPVFLLVCGAICLISFIIIKKKDAENDDLPVRSAVGKIVDKDQPVPNAVTFVGWLMFETEDGERVRVSIKSGHDYLVGDKGKMTWQGSRFISFERMQ